jgi:hypothetical protein
MFQRQFPLTWQEFYALHSEKLHHKSNHHDYDEGKHHKYAKISSGSSVTLELRLLITPRIFNEA